MVSCVIRRGGSLKGRFFGFKGSKVVVLIC